MRRNEYAAGMPFGVQEGDLCKSCVNMPYKQLLGQQVIITRDRWLLFSLKLLTIAAFMACDKYVNNNGFLWAQNKTFSYHLAASTSQ